MFNKTKLLLGAAALSCALSAGATQGPLRVNSYLMMILDTENKNNTLCQRFQYKTEYQMPIEEDWASIDEAVNVVVPAQVRVADGAFEGVYTITSIAMRAFQCVADPMSATDVNAPVRYELINSVKTVSLPNTITTMGYEVFQNCGSITTVNIPSSVTSMDYSTFENCTSLVNVDFQPTLSNGILPEKTFKGCSSLEEITLPESINVLGPLSFEDCTALKKITFKAPRLVVMASDAFAGVDLSGVTVCVPAGCAANFSQLAAMGATVEAEAVEPVMGETFNIDGVQYRTTSIDPMEVTVNRCTNVYYNGPITIPQTVEYLGNVYSVVAIKDNAFDICSSITSVTLPEGLRGIGASAFARCYMLGRINLPSTLTKIGTCAFEGTLIESLVVPESVTTLEIGAFAGAAELTEIEIKGEVEELGNLMFRNCESLQKVTFPASMTSLGDGIFTGCTALNEIVFNGTSLSLAENALADAAFANGAWVYTERDYSDVVVVIPDAASLSGFDAIKDLVACVKTPDGEVIYGQDPDNPDAPVDIIVYSIRAKDFARGALYADPEQSKLAAVGSTYNMAGYNTFKNIAIDPTSPLQQFVLIEFEGNKYMYNLGTEKFCRTHGGANTCVDLVSVNTAEASINHIEVEYQEVAGTTYTIIKYGDGNLNFSNGSGHYGAIRIAGGGIDDGTRMLCTPVEGVTLTKRQYSHAINILRGGERLEKYNAALEMLSHRGVGYPVQAERDVLTDVVYDLNSTVEDMEAAINAYCATTNIVLPESGKAYAIKARYTNGTYRYVTFNGTRLHISNTKPTDGTDIFVLKSTGTEGHYAMLNPAVGMFLTYYADDKQGVDGNTKGYVPDYLTEDGHNAEVILSHLTQSVQNVAASDLFGTISIGAYNAKDNAIFRLMAGDNNYHNGNASQYYFTNNRSSFFEFEEVEHPMEIAFNDANHMDLGNMVTYVAPYKTVLPEGVKAYFISEVAEAPLSRSADTYGIATVKELTASGHAVPANTPVILSGSLENATLEPATTEAAAEIPADFENQLGVTVAGDVNRHVLNGEHFELTANPAPGSIYLRVPAEHTAELYTLDASDTTTEIKALEASAGNGNEACYDLLGRKVNKSAKGLLIVNGKKVMRL